MDFIISLAHFCEIHGPTTVLCTQLAPISFTACFPLPTPPTEDISKNSSFSSAFWEPHSPVLTPGAVPTLYSPFTSPPASPRAPHANYNPYFGNIAPPDPQRSRRFSVSSDTEHDACDNCNFLIPKDMRERLPTGAPGSPSQDGKGQHGSPVLRTTQSVMAGGNLSFSDDDDDDDEDTEEDGGTHSGRNGAPTSSEHSDLLGASPESSHDGHIGSVASSPLLQPSTTHMHNLIYVTRRHPESLSVYSRLRQSCLRTLSCETLPRGSPSGVLLFGDDIAGYTIAYIFRLPDPRARGRRRTYALTALGRDCWRVITAMVQVTKAFEAIAAQIINMADRVLEKESALLSRPATADLLKTPPLSSSLPTDPVTSTPTSPRDDYSRSSANSPVSSHRVISDVSSFLSAKKIDSGGFPRVSRDVMRAKALTEIVGKDNFFVELHAQFCLILSNLAK